jgi:hypothetical protein
MNGAGPSPRHSGPAFFSRRYFEPLDPELPNARHGRLRQPNACKTSGEARARLLLVGATEDHTVPASPTKAQYKRYERSAAKTDYLEFGGRPHLHNVAPDWQEVADAIDSWLDSVFDAPVAVTQQAP